MMSSMRFRLSTMAMAVLVALALVNTATFVSASVSVTTSRNRNRNLRVEHKQATQFAAECSNDPKFELGGSKKKSCDWIGKRRNKKQKERLCKKNIVKKHCPVACDNCDTDTDTDTDTLSCPRRSNSKVFRRKFCADYEDGLECGYNNIYTGCNTGDMACMPVDIYTCNIAKKKKRWQQLSFAPELCEPTQDDRPYGKSCDPKECPPAAPLGGASCSWYEGGGTTCGYEPKWYGCTEENFSCKNSETYECDPVSQTWIVQILVDLEECVPENGIPKGEDCDPANPVIPVTESCPATKPEPGSGCQQTTEQPACLYGYTVLGCNSDNLQCTPTLSYTCGSKDNEWKEEILSQPKCISDDPQWGLECDPNGCPPSEPEDGGDCSSTSNGETCLYDYVVRGCSPDDFFCGAGKSYTCSGKDDTWKMKFLNQIECFSDDPLWGRPCSPFGCPPSEPTSGEACTTNENQTCLFDYEVLGCTSDSLKCTPTTSYTCEKGGKGDVWEEQPLFLPACVADDPLWGTDCRINSCPPVEPEDGSDCSQYYGDDSCPYKGELFACLGGDLFCRPTVKYSCTEKMTWEFSQNGLPKCVWSDDKDFGESCPLHEEISDGKGDKPPGLIETAFECPDFEPETGSSCAETTRTPDAGCGYNHLITGCVLDDIACTPIDTYHCMTDDGSWIHEMNSIEFCADQSDTWLAGEGCDPYDFDKQSVIDAYLQMRGEKPEKPKDPAQEPKKYSCPDTVPDTGSTCGEEPHPPEGCEYHHSVQGCDYESLFCGPLEVANCEMIGMPVLVQDEDGEYSTVMNMDWQTKTFGMEQCLNVPDGWPAGEGCDPKTFDKDDYVKRVKPAILYTQNEFELDCPVDIPKIGVPCDGPGSCGYNYMVLGCAGDRLSCAPIVSATCVEAEISKKEKDGFIITISGFAWEILTFSLMQCENEAPEAHSACDPETFVAKN